MARERIVLDTNVLLSAILSTTSVPAQSLDDSCLLGLDAGTGKTVWKTDRDELPSWGTPTVITTAGGDELVTNASNYIRGYDPRQARNCGGSAAAPRSPHPHPVSA